MSQYRNEFRKKINELENFMEELCDLTMQNYKESIELFENYSEEKYNKIEENNKENIAFSKEIEDKCVIILATEQPVANDLRSVESAIKIASHLKRIGKLSVDIARIANEVQIEKIPQEPLNSMNKMAKEVENMLIKTIKSLKTGNIEEIKNLNEDDDVIDDLFDKFLVTVTESMKKDTETIDILVHFLLIARYLERIGDRTVDIGGRIFIMVQRYDFN